MYTIHYTSGQFACLLILRLFIGWHFLYEGIVKLLNPNWCSYAYLMDSQGYFSFIFHKLATSPVCLGVVNIINIYALTLIGLGLVLGAFSRLCSVLGLILIFLFYLSHPPFIGASYMMPADGSYLWVDKNLIEAAALAVLYYFPTSHVIGFDRYLSKLTLQKFKTNCHGRF